MIKNKKSPSILETHILYLFTGLLLLTLGTYAQRKNLYVGLLITEYIIVLLPAVLFLKLKGYSFKENLRLNKITLKQVIITILIVIFSYPVAVFLNFIGITILSQFGELNANMIPLPSTLGEFIVSFLIIALTPGICEEIMFRGVIMSSYNRLGKKKAIIYSAIIFAIFHFNGQNLLGPIYLGILLGVMAYKTNSLYTVIIGHTVNNTIALTIGFFATQIGVEVGGAMSIVPGIAEFILAAGVLGLGALGFGYISYNLLTVLPESGIAGEEIIKDDANISSSVSLIEIVPIIIIVILFIFWNNMFLFN